MACFRKCQDNNSIYICYTILHKDTFGCEYTKMYLFCSNECLEYFKKNYTTKDENNYEYFNEIIDNEHNKCPLLILNLVAEYKKKCVI